MDNVRANMDLYEQGRLTFALMETDIQGAYTSEYTDYFAFLGENLEHESAASDTLNFITTSHRRFIKNAAETDICEVGYGLVFPTIEDGPGILYRRVDPIPDREPGNGGRSWEVLSGVLAFNLDYYDGNEWNESWTSQGKNLSLPKAVRVTLTMEDSSEQGFEMIDVINIPLAQ